MMKTKTDDGDGVQPVVVFQCRIEMMPASFWFKVVMFLAWSDDASAMHATSKAVRDHTICEWQQIVLIRKGLRSAWHHTLLCFAILDGSHNC